MSGKTKESKSTIVSTHDSLSPIMGGGGLRTLAVARELKKRGQRVTIIAPCEKRAGIEGMDFCFLRPPRKQRSQILSALKFNLRLLIKMMLFIRKTDIVFIHNTIAAVTAPFLKKFFKFKFFLDITDIHAEYLYIGQRSVFERILTPFLLKYEYFIINSADFITVATKAMRELLILKGLDEKKIEVVYDGVDIEKVPQFKEKGADHKVIHLGAIDRQHGVEILVQAIPMVIEEIPHAEFLFVGGGRELLNVKNLAKKLGIFEKCIFTDWLPQEESRKALEQATVGIIPRTHALPNRIITTLKIYEYWASRTAVIAAPLEGIKEVANHNENILWFQPSDAKDLGRKIILLLKNKELKDRLIEGGMATVNNFDIAKSASRIADFVLT